MTGTEKELILLGLFLVVAVNEDSAAVSGAVLSYQHIFPAWQPFAACFLGMCFMSSSKRSAHCGSTSTTKGTCPNFRKLWPCGVLVVLNADSGFGLNIVSNMRMRERLIIMVIIVTIES